MTEMTKAEGEGWALYLGDCVPFAAQLPANSVDLIIGSPPFSNLYIYSESVADMGNTRDDEEFFASYRFLVREMRRALRPGRLVAQHVKDLVHYQNSTDDGTSGLRPFSDRCTTLFIEEGFTFHCRIPIGRDAVLERAKTNAHGLLWKTFQADASFCRTGLPEYLMVYRKWARDGEEHLVRPVVHPRDRVPLTRWQELAASVWNNCGSGNGDLPGWSATDVLNVLAARDEQAEKHLCPMPLNIIEGGIELWSNAGDVVFDPFSGVGSTGYQALKMKRRFIGTELNPAYFRQATQNLARAEAEAGARGLFDVA